MPSKKTNTAIFMIAATLINIVLLFVFMMLGLIGLNLVVTYLPVSESLFPVLMLVFFVLAIALALFVYSRLVKWATAKYGLEDKLAPLFSSGRRKTPKED